jgi:hypothetical protein
MLANSLAVTTLVVTDVDRAKGSTRNSLAWRSSRRPRLAVGSAPARGHN